ncbi:hypothetical protein K8I85_15570 [bacterium]|nr:hypothetical protein [bacterium]
MDEHDFATDTTILAGDAIDSADDSPWDESWDDDWDDEDPIETSQTDSGDWNNDDVDALGRVDPLEGF